MTEQKHHIHKRILLAVIGLSPQVLTKILYVLATKNQAGCFIPTEIHIITTREGSNRIKQQLLDYDTGKFYQLCHDYALQNITFNQYHIHLIQDNNGRELDDIISEADNQHVANFILGMVNYLTQDTKTALHASITGGRKIMGYYLGYALTLFGREQDQLSHVRVDSDYEALPDFYYRTPYSHIIYDGKRQALDTAHAQIQLVDIPFISLRHQLTEKILQKHLMFNQLSEPKLFTQRFSQPVLIKIQTQSLLLSICEQKIPLTELSFVFYLWMLKQNEPIKRPSGSSSGTTTTYQGGALNMQYVDSFIRLFKTCTHKDASQSISVKNLQKNGMEANWMSERISNINRLINKTLGQYAEKAYGIQRKGERNDTKYYLPAACQHYSEYE